MKNNNYSAATIIILSLVLFSSAVFAAPQKSTAPAPKTPPSVTAAKEDASALSGKVVETMNAGGYTYVCLEKSGKKTWVAVPEMKVTVGQNMSFLPGQEMANFASKSLNRTFDTIVFSGGPAGPQAATGMPAGHGEMGKTATGAKAASSALDKDVKVEKAAGPDAYTVSEVYAKSKALNKKTAVVRGKVVKVSAGIMGKNWIHLQDGTGDPQKGTHNLVATSDDLPSTGDVVTVKGTVYKDKDFGGGYLYPVIMEKASVQR